jgi:hypothetical protein
MRNSRLRGGAENPCGSNSSRNECSQRVVHSVGQPTVNTLDNVAIGVERDGYACVSEELLDELGVLACHEEYCSAGVAQILGPEGWKPAFFNSSLKCRLVRFVPLMRARRWSEVGVWSFAMPRVGLMWTRQIDS